jgi:peptidoglycan-associated lipoprotein
LKDFHFDFDSYNLRAEARDTLKSNPAAQIQIEGHCDERGTNAYNLVLGEKRARAVQTFLQDQHLDAGRFSVVSYGKERPFCNAHDEICYQENRRGHLVVRQ